MRIENFKRWHWALVGLALGLIVSWWRGWVGPEGALIGRSTLDITEFEQLLVGKSPTGTPLIKDIRYYGLEEGTDWVLAEQLIVRGNGENRTNAYIPVTVAAQRPFVPTHTSPVKPASNLTVLDYLKSVRATNPQVKFSTRWWDQEPMRSPLFALVGMVVLAGACPAVMQLLLGGVRTGGRGKTHEPQ